MNRLLRTLTSLCLACSLAGAARAEVTILTPKDASTLEELAAREVARYFYLRTGTLPAIKSGTLPAIKSGPPAASGASIIIARKDHAPADLKNEPAALAPQQYILKTTTDANVKTLFIIGGDDAGTLYGAYRFIETLGVRFYLHGDVIPDARIAPALPTLNETGKPIFETRGIQPFHDFEEGPDWWNRDDYLAYIHQLAKLRMNFIGLHCYPEGGVGPEPAVWIGTPADVDAKGKVKFSSQSAWANTARDATWGYAALPTSALRAGAAQLFESDAFGPVVQRGMMPRGATPAEHNAIFNNAGAMLHDAFAEARALGVKTAIGTETPLTIPKLVQEHLKAQGKDPKDPAVVRELYKGIFTRIARLYPVDYYWLWTPENWTWGGNKPEQFAATVKDIEAALGALKELGDPFTLATSGWVLGPQHDRAALDAILPRNVPMSCINRQVGHDPVEPGFAKIAGRPKWAIPWMENDPNLTAPQPWAGRMRVDAASARAYGCTGLLGIHWRTKAMAANVAALAAAGWDQSWVPAGFTPPQPAPDRPRERRGTVAHFSAPVAGTTEQPVYQSVRYNMDDYTLKVPSGSYTVTLKFNEPHYTEAGVRVFGVKLQGKKVIDRLDMFAKAGRNQVIDYSFKDVAVKDGALKIEFIRIVEFPCIAGIVVEGKTEGGQPFVKKINCGGPKYQDYEGDQPAPAPADPNAPAPVQGGAPRARTLPIESFYVDFATASFGPEVGAAAGKILARIDGTGLPEPGTWLGGPGGVKPNPEPWEKVKASYAFVGELEALRPRIKSPGDMERFDYWLNTYRAMAAMAEAGCLRGELDRQAAALKAVKDPAKKKALAAAALQTRIMLAGAWELLISRQIAATDTPGELGTLGNLEQHSRVKLKFVEAHDQAISAALGEPLPRETEIKFDCTSPERIIVPTVRTLARPGEALTLKVIVAQRGTGTPGELHWRPLGGGKFQSVPLRHLARSVYETTLPAAPAGALGVEYYIQATADGIQLRWPATAPVTNQTVIVGLK